MELLEPPLQTTSSRGREGNWYRYGGDASPERRPIEQIWQEAVNCQNKGQLPEALQLSRELLEAAIHSQIDSLQAVAYCIEGNALGELGKHDESLKCFEKVLKLAPPRERWSAEKSWAYNGMGLAWHHLGHYDKAWENYQQSLDNAVHSQKQLESEQGIAYSGMGNIELSLENMKEAFEWHRKHLEIAQRLGNKCEEMKALGNIAIVCHASNEHDAALKYSQRCLGVAEQLDDKLGQALAHSGIGDVFFSLEGYADAIANYERDLALSQEIDHKPGQGRAYCNIGQVYGGLKEYDKAVENYRKHLEIMQYLNDKPGQRTAHRYLGDACEGTNDLKQAIEHYKEDLSMSKELDQDHEQMVAHTKLGDVYMKMNQYEEATMHFEAQHRIATDWGDKDSQGDAHSNIGRAYDSLRKYKEAIEHHEKHLEITRERNDIRGQIIAHINLGGAYNGLESYDKAIKHLKSILEHPELDNKDRGNVHGKLGEAYIGLQDYAKALKHSWEQLRTIGSRNKLEQGVAHCNIGKAYRGLANHEKAIRHHEMELSIAKELNDMRDQGIAHECLGRAYCDHGKYIKAIDHHEEHLSIAITLGDKYGQGAAYSSLGKVYTLLGKPQKAAENHGKGLDIAKDQGDVREQGVAYWGLGKAHSSTGDYQKAIEVLQKSLKISKKQKIKSLEMDAHSSLGQTYLDMGELKLAESHFRGKFEIARGCDNKVAQCDALSDLGQVFQRKSDPQKALKFHKKEMSIAKELKHKPSLVRAYSGHGRALQELGDLKSAIEDHTEELYIAEELKALPRKLLANANLGDAYRSSGDYEKATGYYEDYLELAKQLGIQTHIIRGHANLAIESLRSITIGEAFRHIEEFKSQLNTVEKHLKGEEKLRQYHVKFVENYADSINAWVAALGIDLRDMQTALEMEEWSRYRSLLAHLSDVNGGAGGVRGDEKCYEFKEIVKNIDASFLIVFKMYKDNLMTWVLSAETGKLVYSKVQPNVSNIRELVNDSTLTKWSKWQCAFHIARDRVKDFEKDGEKADEEWFRKTIHEVITAEMRDDISEDIWNELRRHRQFRSTIFGCGAYKKLQSHFVKSAKTALEQLGELLWHPIIKECPQVSKKFKDGSVLQKPVYFLPDTFLSCVPFAALRYEEKYLIETALIAQASSLRILEYTYKRWHACRDATQPPSKPLLVSYDDTTASNHFEDLIQELEEMFNGDTLQGEAATSNKVMEGICKCTSLAHVHAHGVDVEEEQGAGIQVAGKELLTAEGFEKFIIMKRQGGDGLSPRLLVLNSCSSIRGWEMNEGVQGYARAALAGGIPCLLASKWDIYARDSIHLMATTYIYMANTPHKTVAQGFRQAALCNLDNPDSFLSWGAFLPFGCADVILDDGLRDSIKKYTVKKIRDNPDLQSDADMCTTLKAISNKTRRQLQKENSTKGRRIMDDLLPLKVPLPCQD